MSRHVKVGCRPGHVKVGCRPGKQPGLVCTLPVPFCHGFVCLPGILQAGQVTRARPQQRPQPGGAVARRQVGPYMSSRWRADCWSTGGAICCIAVQDRRFGWRLS